MTRLPVRSDLTSVQPYGAPQLDVEVRLNTNETPWPPPAAFTELLARRIGQLSLNRYPDRRAGRLRAAIAGRFGLTPDRVWAANGSNEILMQLLQAYGGADRSLLTFRPTYSMYPEIARTTATARLEEDLDERFRLDPAAGAAAVTRHDPDLVMLASPNNPTGLSVTTEAVRAVHDAGHALVVVDEAYREFAPGGEAGSAVSLLDELERLVVVRTFSKAWRLAGVRLGYLLGPDWVVDDLRRVRLPYHLDAITQEAGLAAIELADEVTAHVAAIVAERERVRVALAGMGVHVFASEGNFLLLRTAVADLFDGLLARGVLVRDFSRQPRLGGCLRVTIGTPEENDAFLTALKECI